VLLPGGHATDRQHGFHVGIHQTLPQHTLAHHACCATVYFFVSSRVRSVFIERVWNQRAVSFG